MSNAPRELAALAAVMQVHGFRTAEVDPDRLREIAGEIVSLRTVLKSLWEWQAKQLELLPDGLSDKIRELIDVDK